MRWQGWITGFVLRGRSGRGTAQAVHWRGVAGAREGAELALFGAGAMRVLRDWKPAGCGDASARRWRDVSASEVWVLSMPRPPLLDWTAPSRQTLASGGRSGVVRLRGGKVRAIRPEDRRFRCALRFWPSPAPCCCVAEASGPLPPGVESW